MLDSKQIKVLGLRFARALQTTVKTAGVFTIEHKSCDRPIQQSFLLLNNMLKEVGQFTVGFVDNQILLNNLLTTDTSLKNLETEFLKRGIAAITFEPGLTLNRYKKVIYVLAAPTSAIDATGGFLAFLDQNEVEGVRILPAAKNQKKNEAGDTILEVDSEAYILSKQVEEDRGPRDFLDSIDALLESGCFDPSARSEVLSNFATQGVDGTGYGVPLEVPQMVLLKEGEAIMPAQGQMMLPGEHGGGGRSFSAAAGSSPHGTGSGGGYAGTGMGMPGGTGTNGIGVAGYAVGGDGVGSGHASPGFAGASGLPGMEPGGTGGGMPAGLRGLVPNGGSGSFIELVEASVQRSLLEERGNPEKSYASLTRLLRNTGVDKILEKFSPERRQEVSTLPPEQLAAEYFQDTALQLAGKRLTSANELGSANGETQKIQLEEEVVYLLARSLQATHMADRLSQKLTKFIQDYAVPPHIQEKIREELTWTSLVSNKKYARLMEIKRYSNIEFRRVLEVIKDLMVQRDMERATELASHYFEFLDEPGVQLENSELSRAPELIRAISVAHAGFALKTAERLGRTLMREDLPEFIHFQAASTATILAQSIATFEDFRDVLAIGLSLESSSNRAPEKHKKCCVPCLGRLLSDSSIERVTELYLEQRGDSTWSKTSGTLLRYSAPASIETVFKHLIDEEDGRNRLALVRLVSQLGKGGIEVACRYLEDERWYVVRNMCGVLAELKDPELVEHVAPALRHPDARVQQAALKALVKSRAPETASVLAAALPKLAPNVLDEAIDELTFMKNASASAITDLEEFVASAKTSPASKRKALQALGSIQDDGALYAMARLFRMEELEAGLRKASLMAITSHRSPFADTLLKELAASWGPLAEEAKAALDKRKPR
jgi:hypothetical protein